MAEKSKTGVTVLGVLVLIFAGWYLVRGQDILSSDAAAALEKEMKSAGVALSEDDHIGHDHSERGGSDAYYTDRLVPKHLKRMVDRRER